MSVSLFKQLYKTRIRRNLPRFLHLLLCILGFLRYILKFNNCRTLLQLLGDVFFYISDGIGRFIQLTLNGSVSLPKYLEEVNQ